MLPFDNAYLISLEITQSFHDKFVNLIKRDLIIIVELKY